MSGHLRMSKKERKRKSVFEEVLGGRRNLREAPSVSVSVSVSGSGSGSGSGSVSRSVFRRGTWVSRVRSRGPTGPCRGPGCRAGGYMPLCCSVVNPDGGQVKREQILGQFPRDMARCDHPGVDVRHVRALHGLPLPGTAALPRGRTARAERVRARMGPCGDAHGRVPGPHRRPPAAVWQLLRQQSSELHRQRIDRGGHRGRLCGPA